MSKLPPGDKLPLAVRKNDLDDAKQFSYCGTEVQEGRLSVLFSGGYLGTNIDDAVDRNVLLKAPNDTTGARGLRHDTKLRRCGRTSVLKQQKFEGDELLRDGFHKALNKDEITFSIIDKLVKWSYSEPVIEDGVPVSRRPTFMA
ncbi:hypothetical protein DL764_005143 [Monosporascus ibericus]|uniref:Uncharacterized protein n=1 Tax=Monosporascus ibericus TaxID=155417 RepID=A0A4Q4TC15_9PEZI|nr:hypothetical protein DL764_005143 [Monosporascus ibericus]